MRLSAAIYNHGIVVRALGIKFAMRVFALQDPECGLHPGSPFLPSVSPEMPAKWALPPGLTHTEKFALNVACSGFLGVPTTTLA